LGVSVGRQFWVKILMKEKKSSENKLDNIALSCNTISRMSEIREQILKQMRKSGLTIYQVAKMVKGKVPQRTVYAFLTGEKDTGTETASIILRAVGLEIKEKRQKGK
jgi:hypothetical protein